MNKFIKYIMVAGLCLMTTFESHANGVEKYIPRHPIEKEIAAAAVGYAALWRTQYVALRLG